MEKEPLMYMEQLEVRLEDLIHGSGPKSVFKVISRIFEIFRNTTNQKVKFVVAAKTANQINQLCFMSSILSISIKKYGGYRAGACCQVSLHQNKGSNPFLMKKMLRYCSY